MAEKDILSVDFGLSKMSKERAYLMVWCTSPVQTPTEKKRYVMEVANMDRARPPAAMIAPMIVTVRQPYLFTKLLAMGPEK